MQRKEPNPRFRELKLEAGLSLDTAPLPKAPVHSSVSSSDVDLA